MILIGLDVGYTTGAAIIDLQGREIQDISLHEITTTTRDEFYIYNLAKEVEGFLEMMNPDFVSVEGYAYSAGGFFNVYQGEIQAQIKRFMVDHKIPFYSAEQSNLRAAILGKGNAKKPETRKFGKAFCKEHGFEEKIAGFKEAHVFDALVPACYAYHYFAGKLSDANIERFESSIIGKLRLGGLK